MLNNKILMLLLIFTINLFAFDNESGSDEYINLANSPFQSNGNVHGDNDDWHDKYYFDIPVAGTVTILLTSNTDLDYKMGSTSGTQDIKRDTSSSNAKTYSFSATTNQRIYLAIFDNEWRDQSNPYTLKITFPANTPTPPASSVSINSLPITQVTLQSGGQTIVQNHSGAGGHNDSNSNEQVNITKIKINDNGNSVTLDNFATHSISITNLLVDKDNIYTLNNGQSTSSHSAGFTTEVQAVLSSTDIRDYLGNDEAYNLTMLNIMYNDYVIDSDDYIAFQERNGNSRLSLIALDSNGNQISGSVQVDLNPNGTDDEPIAGLWDTGYDSAGSISGGYGCCGSQNQYFGIVKVSNFNIGSNKIYGFRYISHGSDAKFFALSSEVFEPVAEKDYGDAPDTGMYNKSKYDGSDATKRNAERVTPNVYLGSSVTAEATGHFSANADGDSDDAITNPDDLIVDKDAGTYSVTVNVSNRGSGTYTHATSGATQNLDHWRYISAWIDWDNNGIYDNDEMIKATGDKGYIGISKQFNGTKTLTWDIPSGLSSGDKKFMRIRLTECAYGNHGDTAVASYGDCSDADNGHASFGDIEDYVITIDGTPPSPANAMILTRDGTDEDKTRVYTFNIDTTTDAVTNFTHKATVDGRFKSLVYHDGKFITAKGWGTGKGQLYSIGLDGTLTRETSYGDLDGTLNQGGIQSLAFDENGNKLFTQSWHADGHISENTAGNYIYDNSSPNVNYALAYHGNNNYTVSFESNGVKNLDLSGSSTLTDVTGDSGISCTYGGESVGNGKSYFVVAKGEKSSKNIYVVNGTTWSSTGFNYGALTGNSKAEAIAIVHSLDNTPPPAGCEYTFAGAISSTKDSILLGTQAKVYNNSDPLTTQSISVGTQATCDNGICNTTNTLAPKFEFELELGDGSGENFSIGTQQSKTISQEEEFSSITTGSQSDLTINGNHTFNIGNGFSAGTQSKIYLNGDITFKFGTTFTMTSQSNLYINGDITIHADNINMGTQAKVHFQNGTLTLIGNNITLGSQANSSAGNTPDFIVLAKSNINIGTQGGIKGLFYAGKNATLGSQATVTGAITAEKITLGTQAKATYDEGVVDYFCNPPVCTPGDNLAQNPSFEDSNYKSNWTGDIWEGTSYNVPDGSNYGYVDKGHEGIGYQDISIETGKAYKLTFDAAMSTSFKDQYVSIEYLCPAKNPKNIISKTDIINNIQPSHDFQTYTLTLPEAAGDSAYIRIKFKTTTGDYLKVDNFDLRVDCNEQRGFDISNSQLGEEQANDEDMKFTIVTNIPAPVGGLNINYKINQMNNETAIAGSDFIGNTSTIYTAHIPQGSTSVDIFINIIDDTEKEETEDLTVTLQPFTGATIANPIAIGYIEDNDMDPIPPTQDGLYTINDLEPIAYSDGKLRTKISGETSKITIKAISGFSVLHDRERHSYTTTTEVCVCEPCDKKVCHNVYSTRVWYTDVTSSKMNIEEVILHYQDGTKIKLSGPKEISSGDDFPLTIPTNKATRKAWITVKGHSDTVYSTGESIELTAASDPFAIRPDKFIIDLGGYNHTDNPLIAQKGITFKVEAVSKAGAGHPVSEYSGSNFIQTIVDTKYDDATYADAISFGLDINDKSFSGGTLAKIPVKYKEAGDLTIKVKEKSPYFAEIDATDNPATYKIDPGIFQLKVVPHHFDITYSVTDANNANKITFFADPMTDMNSTITYTATAKNKDGDTTVRYDGTNGYAYNQDVTVTHTISSDTTTLGSNLKLLYKDSKVNTNKTFTASAGTTLNLTLNNTDFKDGVASDKIYENFTRNNTLALNPLKLNTTKIEVKESNGILLYEVQGNDTTLATATYYYGRAHAPSPQTTAGTLLDAKIYYEVYCNGCTSFPLANGASSIDSIRWYILPKTVYDNFGTGVCDYTSPRALDTSATAIKPATDSESTIKVTAPKAPHANKVFYTPSSTFLQYHKFGTQLPEHFFNAKFTTANVVWAGEGNRGNTVDTNVSQIINQSIEW